MSIFSKYVSKKGFKHFLFILSIFISFSDLTAQSDTDSISKSIYFVGNLGDERGSHSDAILKAIVEASQKDKKAVFIALGNSTRHVGYPSDKNQRKVEEDFLRTKIMEPLSNFNGRLIFIPGLNEWNKGGHENIDDLESFLQDNSKINFWPNDGCPIERETLSDEVELVMVDTQWYLEEWDHHPYINNKCEIKTRDQFFLQFKDELKDEQNKTIIVALHHPVLTATRQGLIGRMGGLSHQAYYHDEMQYLIGSLESLATQFNDVIFVSGNDKNLQFLEDDGIPQIISGATAKTSKLDPDTDKGHFGSNNQGFAKLNVFKDGSSEVEIFEVKSGSVSKVFSKEIKLKKADPDEFDYHENNDFGNFYKDAIYTQEEVNKSGFYKWFFGKHYRQIYGRNIAAPVLFLDSLPHNVRAITEGGGNQSRSLRLIDDNENEFTVRELRKSSSRFVQSKIMNHYVKDMVEGTVVSDLIQDYYTTAHPYAQFAIGDFLKAIDIPHANPEIVYLPKQKRLGRFNESYGDKLYMFEEHVGDENKDFETFGKPDDIISTSDMLLELQEEKKAKIDESSYVRARLFDMLVGDWDRHEDQWRWALHEQEDGTELYKPIPRDRDQAFSKYDGVFPAILKMVSPLARNMQSYGADLKNVKTFNQAATYLDKAFITTADWKLWEEQIKFIQNNLTDATIDKAFDRLLEDTKDASIEVIAQSMKMRRDNLYALAKDYYDYLKKHEVIVATNKDNTISIERMPEGKTRILIAQKDDIIHDNTYNNNETKEIWLYALDGDDEISVTGQGDNYIDIKIFGGEENDIYSIKNRRGIKVYEYKSKKNTFHDPVRKKLTDAYDLNNYDPKKRKYSNNILLPSIGSDPDAGFKVGLNNTFTTYSLLRNPFTTQHNIGLSYYSATNGLEATYIGEFAHFFYNWNFILDARVTNDTYAVNFFGFGNETTYNEDEVSLDFNRVRISQWHVKPSLQYKTSGNVSLGFGPLIESHQVLTSNEGIANQFFDVDNDVFESQIYAGGEFNFKFSNKEDLLSLPRRGMALGFTAGYKATLDEEFDNKFSYITPMLSFVYPIHNSGMATLATKAKANFILGDNYEFYHAATLGGNTSLRGFRNERFTGETSFFQSTDLRLCLFEAKTGFIPLRFGLSGGYDLGRVWNENEDSEKWHSSYGGSIFINGYKALTANIGYYLSSEDSRLIFRLGFQY